MQASWEPPRLSILQLLQNTLVLRHTSPYIGLNGLISLAAASRSFRSLLFGTPQVFKRVDLSNNKLCTTMTQKGSERHDALISSMLEMHGWDGTAVQRTFEEYLSRPLDSIMGHLVQLNLLMEVRVLILDGLAVPDFFLCALLCGEIKHNIQLLSLRGVEELNADTLAKCIRYLIRSSRPRHQPGLRGIYYFTPRKTTFWEHYTTRSNTAAASAIGVTNSLGARLGSERATPDLSAQSNSWASSPDCDIWYHMLGEVQVKHTDQLWADLLDACDGLIAFDATICRHDRNIYGDPRPKIANIRLSGCHSCRSSPEGS